MVTLVDQVQPGLKRKTGGQDGERGQNPPFVSVRKEILARFQVQMVEDNGIILRKVAVSVEIHSHPADK